MKKQMLGFALVATMIAGMAAGCSSSKTGSATDSTTTVVKDSSSKMTVDTTVKTDTTKVDTTKKPPM